MESKATAVSRVAGCDLGKATARFVVARIGAGPDIAIESTRVVTHEGKPLDAFRDWYQQAEVAQCRALAATGIYSRELIEPVLSGLPERACLEAALDHRQDLAGPLNIIRIGARGYSVLSRDSMGRIQHLENEKCSSGTGETMVKIASRFGLGIQEADHLACSCSSSIPITARCSVFAKSEMTHFGNQGRSSDQLFRGYFQSVARHVGALLGRIEVPGPVLLIGGAAKIAALGELLAELLEREVHAPPDGDIIEALGATSLAAEQARAERLPPLAGDPNDLIRAKEQRVRSLVPARRYSDRAVQLEAGHSNEETASAPSVLGIDLGSTGSKALLTSVASGEPLADVYDQTRGNPVEAMQRLLTALLAKGPLDVRAIGVTGSGREAAATVLRGVYPEDAARIIVVNEIVAHGTAAIRCDPDHGRSLSVVEIGGQDAKFIQIVAGQIVESDLNKACSAGTGSFLEEQAMFYGVDDIQAFARMAEKATRPPDLGQMCTVFVADTAAEALQEGYDIPDIFAGFQYAVIHNYINRVMGQRAFGDRVFFQGKPATSRSLAWTLAAVTGRDVMVPANPGAMGAWGIGLCGRTSLGQERLCSPSEVAFDLRAALDASVVDRDEIRCNDKRCATLCVIEKTTVAVGDAKKSVFSGGACPKFEISSAARPKLPQDAPSAFDEREALLARFHQEGCNGSGVAVAHVGALQGMLPWAVTFLRELGQPVRVLRSFPGALRRGEGRTFCYDNCAPVKVAHGVVDAQVETLFFPKILDLGFGSEAAGKTCPVEQALPEILQHACQANGRPIQLLHPALGLGEGTPQFSGDEEIIELGARLGVSDAQIADAALAAGAAQERYQDRLAAIGQRTLAFAQANNIPVVVVCGALHVLHDPAVNAGIPALLRQNGVLPLPMDCFPRTTNDAPELSAVPWADARGALQVAIATRQRRGVYPLLLTAFGCGPGSFLEHLFSHVMDGVPHTVLETDGHGGAAGYVTRIQAFLHTVRQASATPSPVPAARLEVLELHPRPSIETLRDSRLVFFPMGDRLAPLSAAYYRSVGFDAVAAGPTSTTALEHGRRDCSGKECLPYQLIWGSFRQQLENSPSDKRQVLMEVYGEGSCRNCMFTLKDRISLDRLGLSSSVEVRAIRPEPELERSVVNCYWSSIVAWDIMLQLAASLRPLEPEPGWVDERYEAACTTLETHLEQQRGQGLVGAVARVRWLRQLIRIVDRACESFVGIQGADGHDSSQRTVLVAGDIYLRLDEFGSGSLVRRLNARGLRVLLEPTNVLVEYLSAERSAEFIGLPKGPIKSPAMRHGLAALRHLLYGRARRYHRWLPIPDVSAMQRAGLKVLARHPVGEAPITIGSVLHNWQSRTCDGVVLVSPWGCGPALIAESLLRHHRDIPTLFVYCDGSPLDEGRVDDFAFRLRREPPRVGAPCPHSGISVE